MVNIESEERREATFSYKIEDLFKKVYTLSSHLAQGVKSKDGEYMHDGLILSHADKDTFVDLLFNEAGRCYEPFIKFGRNTPNAYYISHGGSLIELPAVNANTFSASGSDDELTISLSQALAAGVQAVVTVGYTYKVRDILGDISLRSGRCETTITSGNGTSKTITPTFEVDNTDNGLGVETFIGLDNADIAGVRYTYLLSNTIHKGDIVKATKDGKISYYSVNADTNSGDIDDRDLYTPIKGDFRDSLVFVMMLPHKFNENMLSVIDSDLEQAVITAVLLRWFQLVGGTVLGTLYQQLVDNASQAYERLQGAVWNGEANDKVLPTRWF